MEYKLLIKYKKIILFSALIAVFFVTFTETIGFNWGLWSYSSEKILGIFIFKIPFEHIFLYSFFLSIALVSMFLIFSEYESQDRPIIKTFLKRFFIRIRGNKNARTTRG